MMNAENIQEVVAQILELNKAGKAVNHTYKGLTIADIPGSDAVVWEKYGDCYGFSHRSGRKAIQIVKNGERYGVVTEFWNDERDIQKFVETIEKILKWVTEEQS